MKLLTLVVFGLSLFACKKDDHETPVNAHQTAVTKHVSAGGINYAYRELGNKAGIPVVMVSPLGSSMDDWDPAVTNGLAKQYKVILFDLPGAAGSDGTTPDSIAGMATAVRTFIKALGLQKVNLVGFSLGSFISQQIALTEPGLINKMVLTGTGPKGATGLSDLTKLLAAGANLTAEENFLFFGFTNSANSVAAGKASWERIQQRTENRDAAVSQVSAGAQVAAVLKWAQPYEGAVAELKTITQPVLIIQGEKDVPVPVVNAQLMAANIPNAKLIVYPDAAHASLFQNADDFVRSVTSFLGK